MTVMVVQQIDDTHDYNFIYNNSVVAVALLQYGEYYLYFNTKAYDEKVLSLSLNSLKTLNDSLKQEKSE
jgi:hypothetical protein